MKKKWNRRRCPRGMVITERDQLGAFAGAISRCVCCKNCFGHFGHETVCGFYRITDIVNPRPAARIKR